MVTLGPQLGVLVANALKESGSTVKTATYAFNSDVIPLLQSGDIAFTIDQQPWLQGYMAIDSLWQYKKNNSVLGAQLSTPTGPVVVRQGEHRHHHPVHQGRHPLAAVAVAPAAPSRRAPQCAAGPCDR